MSIGDVYFLLDKQLYLGQECLNRYWYMVQVDAAGSNAEDLLVAWIASVLPDILAFQQDLVEHTEVEAYLWENPIGNYSADTTGWVGDQTTIQSTPSATAVAYRSSNGGPGTRYGQKRYVGVPEEFINGNTVTSGAPFVDLETSLGVNIAGSDGGVYQPVLVRTQSGGVNVLPPLGTGAPLVSRALNGVWSKRDLPSSQRSRRPKT